MGSTWEVFKPSRESAFIIHAPFSVVRAQCWPPITVTGNMEIWFDPSQEKKKMGLEYRWPVLAMPVFQKLQLSYLLPLKH